MDLVPQTSHLPDRGHGHDEDYADHGHDENIFSKSRLLQQAETFVCILLSLIYKVVVCYCFVKPQKWVN